MAVAIKNTGFTNIKIYNGGIKDWIKSGKRVQAIEVLPDTEINLIDADELMMLIAAADKQNCIDSRGQPLLTLIDLRVAKGHSGKKGADKYRIKTRCHTITTLLDDFLDNSPLIQSIPENSLTVSISETGNRDEFLIRYLSKFGRNNIRMLTYGMRSWLKANYPVEEIDHKGNK